MLLIYRPKVLEYELQVIAYKNDQFASVEELIE
jgi:hypothetical protein